MLTQVKNNNCTISDLRSSLSWKVIRRFSFNKMSSRRCGCRPSPSQYTEDHDHHTPIETSSFHIMVHQSMGVICSSREQARERRPSQNGVVSSNVTTLGLLHAPIMTSARTFLTWKMVTSRKLKTWDFSDTIFWRLVHVFSWVTCS